ncbi:MAG: transposase [Clostridia bacterium]|nr:transposase [Clostridia bacterium]
MSVKADTAKPTFYESIRKLLMHRAKRKNSAHILIIMDACHFVHGCDFLGGVYSKVCRLGKNLSERHTKFLGLSILEPTRVHTVTNAPYITATEIARMLHSLASDYAGKKNHVVLDNARYQKCEAVTALAQDLQIDGGYLPPYSQHLNLKERLWKSTKGE